MIPASKITNTQFPAFRPYIQHLLSHPRCFAGHSGVICSISFMNVFEEHFDSGSHTFLVPELRQTYDDIQKEMSDELFSSLHLVCPNDNPQCKRSDLNNLSENGWVEVFERLLERAGEERPFSDLELQSLLLFLSRRPKPTQLLFATDGTFRLAVKNQSFTSATFHAKSLCSLFTPTQQHHAPPLITSFRSFVKTIDEVSLILYILDGWVSSLFGTVHPSTLPFTPDFIPLHTVLIDLIKDRLKNSDLSPTSIRHLPPQLRSELDERSLSFFEHSKEYLVHLSLHPFAIANRRDDAILDFLSFLIGPYSFRVLSDPYRKMLIEEMDASALSSSSPPLILTTELVRPLSDEETIQVVDRIIAHIDRNTFLDDNTILPIFVFIQRQLHSPSLPKLFKKVGRTPNQYFHALNSFLSLGHNSFLSRWIKGTRPPVNNLFLTKSINHSPTNDDWKDVYVKSILILINIGGALITSPQVFSIYDE
ncbi:hypothetical protein BLNAU_11127 [Blattamonas nauphoetae]|uniref:Uncharacterized protein n=1 Tax=Blattamonas nauphoetae TaxID=2049346 RepID=A0ABQ9XQY2_9EUKA|nr:hypothetical protein BLNAU_11127 [Blattamonas nauphoetae]